MIGLVLHLILPVHGQIVLRCSSLQALQKMLFHPCITSQVQSEEKSAGHWPTIHDIKNLSVWRVAGMLNLSAVQPRLSWLHCAASNRAGKRRHCKSVVEVKLTVNVARHAIGLDPEEGMAMWPQAAGLQHSFHHRLHCPLRRSACCHAHWVNDAEQFLSEPSACTDPLERPAVPDEQSYVPVSAWASIKPRLALASLMW